MPLPASVTSAIFDGVSTDGTVTCSGTGRPGSGFGLRLGIWAFRTRVLSSGSAHRHRLGLSPWGLELETSDRRGARMLCGAGTSVPADTPASLVNGCLSTVAS